jgi:exosortase B
MSHSVVIPFKDRLHGLRAAMPEWWPILLGLLVLYVPTFFALLTGLWVTEADAYQPIMFFLAMWLVYRQWPLMAGMEPGTPSAITGWMTLVIALSLDIIGRTLQIYIFELGSLILVLSAILLIKRGGRALKVMWFPFFIMLFMIPLPGTLIIMLTMPMKMAVSYVTTELLYSAGYPVARSGVILQIGQYQLLVAEACAGLHTLFALEALGLLYLNIVRHASLFRNVALAILIIPISFVANVIRVTAISLITYYSGDAAGQGFLHWFAGVILFLSALILIQSVDKLLRLIVKARSDKAHLQAI